MWVHTDDNPSLLIPLSARGQNTGEKISPLEVDAAMLSHPSVAEAVSFSIPHEIYGEVVGAAIVLKEGQELDEEGLKTYLADKLASFKVPTKVFFDTTLPKTPTGKIQRRFVAAHFLK
jgi:acyl-coenzyme A synthetase/AMP-(fatty) acid ligase